LYSIKVAIIDKSNMHAIENATVELLQNDILLKKSVTAYVNFTALCKGEYELIVHADGYESAEQHIDILNADWQGQIKLQAKSTVLKTVNVVAKTDAKATLQMNTQTIENTKGSSLSELLAKQTGVQLLQTGTNVSKPIINGLSGSRVVLVNNGIRLEGQQWGNDHAPEIDAFAVNQIRVVTGAEQLKYGGDAIG
jgi:iron complex outermembrane recepter protein